MIAVIKTGGKQYLVEEGAMLKIEKLEAKPGETVYVLAISTEVILKASTGIWWKSTSNY